MSDHVLSPAEKARMASEARRLLEDPVLAQALTNIESGAFNNLLALSPEAPEASRTYYITKLQVMKELRGELDLVIQNGMQAVRPAPAIA